MISLWNGLLLLIAAVRLLFAVDSLAYQRRRRRFLAGREPLSDSAFLRELNSHAPPGVCLAVRDAFAAQCGLPAEMLSPDDSLPTLWQFPFGGFDLLDLIFRLEAAFGQPLPDSARRRAAANLTSVAPLDTASLAEFVRQVAAAIAESDDQSTSKHAALRPASGIGFAPLELLSAHRDRCPHCHAWLGEVAQRRRFPFGEVWCPGCYNRVWYLNATIGCVFYDASTAAPIREQAIEVLAQVLEVDIYELRLDPPISDQDWTERLAGMTLDSLDMMELAMQVEDELQKRLRFSEKAPGGPDKPARPDGRR